MLSINDFFNKRHYIGEKFYFEEKIMKQKLNILALLISWAFACSSLAFAAQLPKDIKWVTNDKAKPFASENAQIGGVLKTSMPSYPLTFRLYGPNSNDGFATWNRVSCLNFSLVERHPYTLEHIPGLATHWAVMPDQKTIYFKLDPDVKFSDGTKVTADNYVFAYKMMLSKDIKDPYYNKYYKERFEKIEKIDDYTLMIKGAYASWQALDSFSISPEAKHAIKLDKNWVKKANWKSPVCVGPYKIGKVKKGRYVNLERVKNWWGDKKKFYKNRYNFQRINLKVIRDRVIAYEHFKKGNLSYFPVLTASIWAKDTDFEAVKKGWVVKRRIFTKSPEGKYGMVMNYKTPIFQDKNFRKALQHLFDFNKINKNLMHNSYVRQNSFWGGTAYEHPNLSSYPYNPKKAEEYLKKAGWTKRGPDGYLVNSKGERCSFTLTYGSATLGRHISIYVEDLKEAGVEMRLRLVDGAKAFRDGLDKNFQALLFSRSAGIYPSPEQYLHSDYAKTKSNNNVFSFANKKVDKLLEVYKKDLDVKKRMKAMHKIEEIVKEDAFYIPFWSAPFVRVLFWNNLGFIKDMEPRYASGFNEYHTYWFSPEKDKKLKEAMKKKSVMSETNPFVDYDPHHLIKK